jgi:tRNA1(Val) A37 N6-methylase TrmN6
MCILDPCAGEGVAIAEAAHALGREQAKAFAVEFDAERARHARSLVDHCLHADLMDTMVSKQSFGLLWLNPPYGDLSKDVNGNIGYQGQGRARLEKLFYQRTSVAAAVRRRPGLHRPRATCSTRSWSAG